VFELVLTKLPHYVMPLYPAIAILTVGALERRVLSRSPGSHAAQRGGLWCRPALRCLPSPARSR